MKTSNRKGTPTRKGQRRDSAKEYRKDRKDKVGAECDEVISNSKPNDWRWYAQNESLLRDSASYPYSWPLGNAIDLGITNGQSLALPGLMTLEIVPTIGWSATENSPINVASRNVYSWVRHKNSGHANYDNTDLMLYLIAMDSAYSMWAFLRRIYGVARDYSPTNRYYPRAIIEAMHVSFEDVMNNLAQLRYFINSYRLKVTSMCIPSSMPYMARHMWMYSGLYVDGVSDKAQTYMYTPYGFFNFQLDSSGAGMLKLKQLTSYATGTSAIQQGKLSVCTVEDLFKMANDILNPIIADEDMNIMSGDILKAYGNNGVVTLPDVPENYAVIPTFDSEVLAQIQNSNALGYPYTGTTLADDKLICPNTDVWQQMDLPQSPWLRATPNTQWLYTSPFASIKRWQLMDATGASASQNLETMWQYLQDPYCVKRMVTFGHGDITPADTMTATRLTNIATRDTNVPEGSGTFGTTFAMPSFPLETVGSEYVCVYGVWTWLYQSVQNQPSAALVGYLTTTGLDILNLRTQETLPPAANQATLNYWNQPNITSVLTTMFRFSTFAKHPALYVRPVAGYLTPATPQKGALSYVAPITGAMYDADYYTVLDKRDLVRMADAALLSEFSVPLSAYNKV